MAYALYGMPSLIHAVAWWLAGLIADTWWQTGWPWALLALAGAVLLRTRRLEPLLLPAALLAAWSGRTEREQCTRVLHERGVQHGALWLVVLDVDSGSGRQPTRARGTVADARVRAHCEVSATVQFAATDSSARRLRAGATVRLVARALRTTAGLRLTDAAVVQVVAGRRPLIAWRAELGRVIDARFRSRAPLVRALLIADQQGIPPDVRDLYADAGLVHMLSVSGLHVAIIASALLTLGGAARVPRAWLDPMAMTVVALYIVLLGCPAPAVRSGVMLAVMSLSRRLQRPVHEWTALALGAVLPTIDPLVVHDLGWQLSVAGMASLVAARALRRHWKAGARSATASMRRHAPAPRRLWYWLFTRRGVAGWFVAEMTTGVVATVVTLPIIAWTFGRVSTVAPLSNIAAGPVVGALQPALFLALLWGLTVPSAAGSWLPDATQPLMALLDGVARLAASVPGGVLPVAPTLATALGGGLAAALVVRGTAARRGTPWYVAAAGAAVGALWAPLVMPAAGDLEMHVLDVGQGDAIALRTPRGRWILVDAGRRWRGGDAGRRTVIPYLRRRGGDVALFVLSHPHDDHAGGAASVVRALQPRFWWEPAFVTASPGYRGALAAVRAVGSAWSRVAPGRTFVLDGVTLTVLAPDSSWTMAQHDANETSVVLRVAYGRTRLLLTGDAERGEEDWLLRHYRRDELAADVLKLGHHGSRTSSSVALLDAVAPRLAIASVGAGNRYGHPAPETLGALLARGIPALRTDLEGTVVVRSNGEQLTVETHGDHWILPPVSRVRPPVE